MAHIDAKFIARLVQFWGQGAFNEDSEEEFSPTSGMFYRTCPWYHPLSPSSAASAGSDSEDSDIDVPEPSDEDEKAGRGRGAVRSRGREGCTSI